MDQIWVQARMTDYSLNWTAKYSAIPGWQRCDSAENGGHTVPNLALLDSVRINQSQQQINSVGLGAGARMVESKYMFAQNNMNSIAFNNYFY